MTGSETLTAVLSMKVIAEPRIAAIKTHGIFTSPPFPVLQSLPIG